MKTCVWCEGDYDPVNDRQKFCQRKCYRSFHSKRTGERNNKQRSESGRYVFRHIKDRCNNPKSKAYDKYGAMGIRCEFENNKEFVAWYNKSDTCKNCGVETDVQNKVTADNGKQVDRIDASGPYSKKNCRILCRKCNLFMAHQRR
jgi:hypothetical protein